MKKSIRVSLFPAEDGLRSGVDEVEEEPFAGLALSDGVDVLALEGRDVTVTVTTEG